MLLSGKTVVLGVSGSIAAYKIPTLARLLKKQGCNVQVLMTQNATQFINPITFESLTGNKCLIDTFDRNFQYSVEHVALAKQADLVMVAPASANVIGKIAYGIADDMLTTTVMACPCKKMISPAMNHNMYHNPIVQDNIRKLERFGYEMIAPDRGMLANGDDGDGRMPEPEVLFEYILRELAFEKDLAGKNVLVTAGATMEAIDPVRYITNHSSGKMGYALAKRAYQLGAKVTLISGPTDLRVPYGVEVINIKSARAMFEAVKESYEKQDYIIKAAAVGDYRVKEIATNKIKKHENSLILEMVKNDDILTYLGAHKTTQTICGFAMETQNLIENAKDKFKRKNCDLLVANNLNENGAGFKKDTNKVTFISKNDVQSIELMSKDELSDLILKKLIKIKESHSC